MRFVEFTSDEGQGFGVPVDGGVLGSLSHEPSSPGDLESLIRGGADMAHTDVALRTHGRFYEEATIRYRPPLARPSKIICVGLNYRDHSAESGFKQPDYPALFPRFPSSLIGHGDPMIRPEASDTLDFEGELVAVIGRGGRHISKASALDHVAGYSIFNDGSVREYQFKSPQWTVGKNFDGTGAFGPLFVTADELPPGARGLRLTTRLNGAVVQSASTDDLVFDVATLVSIISAALTLEPGDVIVTGTPSGVGHARDPRLYMQPGDVCEVEIEGIGVLRNTVANEGGLLRAVA